jgi:aspartyl-tRNA(Asn)/glutamyl-tRNA(Gln) amidotransferase subunit C
MIITANQFLKRYLPVLKPKPLMGYICFMQVDDALIDKLSRLAMLEFDESERQEIKTDLEKMIGFIDKLKELDTTGVEPLLHIAGEINVLRDDLPGDMLSREEALQNAPLHDGAFFLVPKVIKKDEA